MQKIPSLTVAADELWRVTEHRPAILLIGSYDGSGNYGDICLFEAALSLLSTLSPDLLLLPVIERQYVGSHIDLRARVGLDFGAACFVYYAEQATDLDTPSPIELAPVPREPGFRSSAVYFYGGGYLNEMWGRRKLAMATAVEEWITSGTSGQSQPLVVFTGQQVSGGFGVDSEAERWVGRASLFGVRDLRSSENVTSRFPQLASRSALVVAEDDAVGVLGGNPTSSDTTDARPDAGNDGFRVDLHLTGESYAITDGPRLGGLATDLLTAIQRETGTHVSVRLVVAYQDRRISEGPFMEDFAAEFLKSASEAGRFSFTVEDATTRRIEDPRWERWRPDLTISCSYHVAMTSLLHEVPVVYLVETDYYRQKAMSLQAGFGLSPELTIDVTDPETDAGLVASIAVGSVSNPQRHARTINRLRLARGRALALRHLVSSRLMEIVSAHMASTVDPEDRFEGLRRSVDELRATVEVLNHTLTGVGKTTDGHTAWLSDLQGWVRSCVQTLSMLADVAPIPSGRVQAAAPPARRRDEVERVQRQLQVWTTMAWLDHTDVESDQLISVVMPTRNRSRWIGRAIASIQAQTYTRWDLVVVDDGSSDDTALVVAEAMAHDERVRYLQIEHAGAPAARNVGLANAKGDLIAYLDDDNVMHSGWLKAVAWAFSSWPQTEVLYGARIIEDDLAHETARSGELPSMSFDPWDRRRLESSNFVDQNVIAHRAGLPEAHFDEALPMCQDWDLMLRLTARRRPLELPALACLYSTTAPHRGSDQPGQMHGIHRVRARAHLGRPLHLLVLRGRPADPQSGRIDHDMASLAEGADVVLTDAPPAPPGPDAETETSQLVAAVAEHDPDVVLVYGVETAAELVGSLEAARRPFAVRVAENDAHDMVAGTFEHSLFLGLWQVPERQTTGSAAGFLEELAERLRIWKLDLSRD